MPNNTFNNISKEKQNRILESGKILFSKHFFENVDVKMIVEKSKIPRGSFYAYFVNIEDYYLTVIKSLQNMRIQSIRNISKEEELDFFSFLTKIFTNDIKESLYNNQRLLIQHNFRYMLTHKLGYHNQSDELQRPIFEVLNKYKDNFQMNKEDWSDFLEFIMNIYLMTYMKSIQQKYSYDQSIKLFSSRINILKEGVDIK
ncbi:MAG: TetR/AcrR family transcriptional regulator [Tenericutes bacterium]|nr:TetR/AcrR family transcriptional regulator [Mycoplasmatota bacterium]